MVTRFWNDAGTQTIKAAVGPLPLVSESEGENGETDADGKLANGTGDKPQLPVHNRPAVLADGSYATQVPEPLAQFSSGKADLSLSYSTLVRCWHEVCSMHSCFC